MMKKLIKLFAPLCVLIYLAGASVQAKESGNFSTAPKMNDGKKWRIGYYEGGKYVDYQSVFITTIESLMDMGWIEKKKIPPQSDSQTKGLWKWLSTDVRSDYIEFVQDAHYSANWDKKTRKKMSADIIKRFNTKKDIDLILAFGTWAGVDLANNDHKTPVISLSVSNALKAGIVKSVDDSGFDHVHTKLEPFRYERQIRIFHDIIGFKNLGVAYVNSPEGKTYAAIDKIRTVAKERGFEIVECFTDDENNDSVINCYREFGEKKIEAIYVTIQLSVNKDTIPVLVDIAHSYKIPTFSQSGAKEVKNGFLMSISRQSFATIGRFHGEAVAKIFNGAKPRQLDMVFETIPKIAINFKTAEIIGYDPPMEVLGTADEVYNEIEKPGKK